MKKLVAVCMALVMALGLAACGGSGSSSSAPAASSGAVSAPAASGTSASEADDGIAMTGGNVEEHSVEAIKAKGVLVVTTEAGYAPFEFLDENDNVVGLDASLAQALADDLGVELDIQNIAFDSVVAEVQAGNADMAIAGLTPNADRKKSVDIANLKNGECAAVMIDEISAEQYMQTVEGLAIGKVPVEIDPEEGGNAVAVMKGNTDLLDWVNERIAAYEAEGLLEQWFQEAQEKAASMGIE